MTSLRTQLEELAGEYNRDQSIYYRAELLGQLVAANRGLILAERQKLRDVLATALAKDKVQEMRDAV